MGNEIRCRVTLDGEPSEAKVQLETEELIVRGAARAVVRLKDITAIDVRDGVLHVRSSSHELAIELGEREAKKWLEKIRNPKSRLEKIGVKRGQRVTVLNVEELIDELTNLGADVSTRLRRDSDIIFFGANHSDELNRLPKLRESLQPAGALWVIRPKGVKEITEAAVMAAGKAAGLVDVKVVKFSETHTAEKLVIPAAKR